MNNTPLLRATLNYLHTQAPADGTTIAHHTQASRNATYGILKRLTEADWATSTWDTAQIPPRRVYTLTNAGRRAHTQLATGKETQP